MNWFFWLLIALMIISMMIRITNVGKPRPAITPGWMAVNVLMVILIIGGILYYA